MPSIIVVEFMFINHKSGKVRNWPNANNRLRSSPTEATQIIGESECPLI